MNKTQQREADRALLLTALTELGEPSRFDQILDHALGSDRWGAPQSAYWTPVIRGLVRWGHVVSEQVGWQHLYRIATDADRAAVEDAAEVERLTRAWDPA